MRRFLSAAAVLLCAGVLSAASRDLRIYFIDVEGGGSSRAAVINS